MCYRHGHHLLPMSGAHTATTDFTDNDILVSLQNNASQGVVWVEGIEHPTFSWDLTNRLADYTAVNVALDKVPQDISVYTDETVSVLKQAIDSVNTSLSAAEQSKVDAMAQAIEDAITALQYKDADYTKVDAAIAKANALNKGNYKDFSAVETAVNAVARGKNITQQAEVDAMAKAIEDAIAALQYKDADKTTPAPAATATPAPAATATPAPVATATPQYTIPQTGDTSNPALLVVLMLVSGSAAIGTAVVASKKKRNR